MEFYITDGITNFGPFSLEQLREKNITATTKVWYAGLSGWTPAGEIPELAGLLASTPPPVIPPAPQFTTTTTDYMKARPPKTWLVESILVTLFCCLPFGIAGIIYASKVESRFYSGDYQGALMASKEAGRWTKIGFFVSLILGILYLIFIAVMVMTNGGNLENFTPIY